MPAVVALLRHNTFTQEALGLIVRSGEGLLRRTRNLCLGSLLEAVRDQTRIVDLKQVSRVLLQPHWRNDHDNPILPSYVNSLFQAFGSVITIN